MDHAWAFDRVRKRRSSCDGVMDDDEPAITQALVPASLISSVVDGSALLSVDATPLVIHALHGLQRIGIRRAVVVLGVGADDLATALKLEQFTTLRVEFLWGVEFNWGSSLANSIMAARAAFDPNGGPLLIVRSDYLYDWRLLQKMACARFSRGVDAFALVDAAPETLEWISGAHCKAHCKDGHCHALVKVLMGPGDHIARIGHRLAAYDALQAGVYVARPILFQELATLLQSQKFCTVADSMQALAEGGRLRFIETAELTCNVAWFGHETMQTALMEHAASVASVGTRTSEAVRPAWIQAALALLFAADDGKLSSSPVLCPRDKGATGAKGATGVPLYELGPSIGQGSNGTVRPIDALTPPPAPAPPAPNP